MIKPIPFLFAALIGAGVVANSAFTSQADASTEPLSFKSGPQRVSVVELYTSEGCSSCPPADRFLSSLNDSNALWNEVVPLAFHVTYWDRLGWPDRFAKTDFDRRQRLTARRENAGVYTPGMFRDGQEWRTWRYQNKVEGRGDSTSNSGTLTLTQTAPDFWQLDFVPAPDYEGLAAPTATLAVLGNNVYNDIERGENAGRKLRHDFVVLTMDRQSLANASQRLSATFKLDASNLERGPGVSHAIAAWVEDDNGSPIQALGGPIPALN